MGVYLSAPVVEKESGDEKCVKFTYGHSSMQGWRMTQEDAHNCLADFDPDTRTSLFAVYDGHGGAEVAKYCATHLPEFIKTVPLYTEGNLGEALQEAFLGFDATLKQEEIIQKLKVIAGLDDDEEEEDDDLMGNTETDMLVAEANMPIDELRKKYNAGPMLPQNKLLQQENKYQSPALKAKKTSLTDENGSSTTDPLASRLDEKLENGEPDNDNNLNTEKEFRDAVSQSTDSDNKTDISDISKANLNNNENSADILAKPDIKLDVQSIKQDTHTDKKENLAVNNGETEKQNKTVEADSTVANKTDSLKSDTDAAVSSSSSGVSSSSSSGECSGSSSVVSSSSGAGSSSSGCSSGGSGSGSSEQAGGSGVSSGVKGKKKTIVDEDFDSEEDTTDDEEDGEDQWEDDSDDEDDDDDDDDDSTEVSGGPGGIFGTRTPASGPEEEHNEEPGSDSGCTAVVALLRDTQLVVANAGDSRCVLCRGGIAVELSFDHKPEDEPERTRIEAAGGEVTNEGRVNGGLNLSRALGDHWYKRNEDKPAKEQMISAFPDIESVTLGALDEFMVIACDGIWNFMTSQEVVDFVREKLKDPKKQKKPSLICEEMFDHCLAPNTMGDGTGCDNMTCVIVLFNNTQSNKRDCPELDTSTDTQQQPQKRSKLDDEVTTTAGT